MIGERQSRAYLSYLLRLWQVDGQEKPLWRASLKNVHTGDQVGFASPEELFAFLQSEMGAGDGVRVGVSADQ
jgi:hypothetical protein